MTGRQIEGIYEDKERSSAQRCIHCQRVCGNLAGGFARIGGAPVCSRPTTPGRPDCFRMIAVKFHPLRNCPECMDTQPVDHRTPPRRGFAGPNGF